jgi:hypothetical protein
VENLQNPLKAFKGTVLRKSWRVKDMGRYSLV